MEKTINKFNEAQTEYPYILVKCEKCDMVGYFNLDTHDCDGEKGE